MHITNLHWMILSGKIILCFMFYVSAFLVPDKLSSSDSTYGQSYIVGADGSQIPRNGTFSVSLHDYRKASPLV